MEERRRFVRVTDLKEVNYRPKGSFSKMHKAAVKDISLIGINFYSNENLEKETIIELELELPKSAKSMRIEGRVIWQLACRHDRYPTGARFDSLEGENKEILADFIAESAKKVDENREFVRCPVDVEINYGHESDRDKKCKGKAGDLSRGGMKLLLNEKPSSGIKLNISFMLPGHIDIIELKGKVVWVRGDSEKGFEAGIIFIQIQDRDKQEIWRFIERYCKKQQKR